MRNSLPVVLAVLILASCAVAQYTGSSDTYGNYSYERPPLGAQDYTSIRAQVLNVGVMDFPYARMTLSILESSNSGIYDMTKSPRVVVVDNYLWRSNGRVDCNDRRNIGAVAAYYLLQGDEIHAKLFSGAGWGSQWYVYGITRIGFSPRLLSLSTQTYDDLELTLRIVPKYYDYREPVTITLTVRNAGSTLKTLEFPTSKRYDFVITLNGQEVWRWSKDKAFSLALTKTALVPGQTVTFAETWRQQDNNGRQVAPGEYQLTGVLTTTDANQPSVGPVRIIVLSRSAQGPVY